VAELFASGTIAAWILGFMAVEACVLVAFRARTQLTLLDLGAALGAGAALLLALRTALRGEAWPLVAFWLLVALGAHLLDLSRRLMLNRSTQKR
jgi:hypothetical protein